MLFMCPSHLLRPRPKKKSEAVPNPCPGFHSRYFAPSDKYIFLTCSMTLSRECCFWRPHVLAEPLLFVLWCWSICSSWSQKPSKIVGHVPLEVCRRRKSQRLNKCFDRIYLGVNFQILLPLQQPNTYEMDWITFQGSRVQTARVESTMPRWLAESLD